MGKQENAQCSIYDSMLEISGYFLRWNYYSNILTENVPGHGEITFREVILDGAINNAYLDIESGKEVCEFKVNHKVIYEGTLKLMQNEKGASFRIHLEPNERNLALYKKVENGELLETSFSFGTTVNDFTIALDPRIDQSMNANKIYIKSIHNISRLNDVSLVNKAAYSGNEANYSHQCQSGAQRGIMATRQVNNGPETTYIGIVQQIDKAREINDLTKKQMVRINDLHASKEVNQLKAAFDGEKNPKGVAKISEEILRALDTTNTVLTNDLTAKLNLPQDTNLENQLKRAGLNILLDGKIQRVNTQDLLVSTIDENEEFIESDFLHPENAVLAKARIGTTYTINNELLASANFVASMVQAASNQIFGGVLAKLINDDFANFATVIGANFTEEFINNAFTGVGTANGAFISNMAAIIPQINQIGASKNVVNRTIGNQYVTENKNPILYGIEQYLTAPQNAIYGDFNYAWVNLIGGLQVLQNPYGAENISKGRTSVTIFREIATGITDPTKFVKSTEA